MNRRIIPFVLTAVIIMLSTVATPPLAAQPCQVLAAPFLDASGMPPAHENTPCYKGIQTLRWGGPSYLAVNYGRGFLLYTTFGKPQSVGGANLYCHLSRPCPGSIPGDYDCPLRRIAMCDDCKYVIANGGAGTGGTVITELRSSGGPPYAGTSWLVEHFTEGGTATYSVAGVQYVLTSRWPGCSQPALWRIDGTTPPPDDATLELTGYKSDKILYLTRLECLSMPQATAPLQALPEGVEGVEGPSSTVMGGLRVGNYLYVASGSATVTIWEISGEALTPVSSAPLAGYYYDGIQLIYDPGSQLMVTGVPQVQLWDVSSPTSPTLVSSPAGGGSVVAVGRADEKTYLWSSDLAGTTAKLWDITNPANPVESGGDLWGITYSYQLWMGGAPCKTRLCLVGGTVAMTADLSCVAIIDKGVEIFADGFESGNTSNWH
jgi:hypothetical protein